MRKILYLLPIFPIHYDVFCFSWYHTGLKDIVNLEIKRLGLLMVKTIRKLN